MKDGKDDMKTGRIESSRDSRVRWVFYINPRLAIIPGIYEYDNSFGCPRGHEVAEVPVSCPRGARLFQDRVNLQSSKS